MQPIAAWKKRHRMGGWVDKWIGVWMNVKMEGWEGKQTEIDRQIYRQIDRWADDRQIDR